jgi:hypothetical protein
MLANVLAVLLGLGSFTFYMTAFVYPEVHRRSDFLWSALGMFYAVVLWFCAAQMSPSVLLGQVAAVILLLGLGWQTLTVRRQKTPVYQQTPIVLTPEVMTDWAKNKLNQLRIAPAESVPLRLEKRALRSDPRRRPVYDYEFVEDGILEAPPKLFSEAPALRLDWPDETAEPTVEHAVPPSAEAEIISVEIPSQADVDPSAVELPVESGVDEVEREEVGGEEVGGEEVTAAAEPINLAVQDLVKEAESSVLKPESSPFETTAAKVDSLEPSSPAELADQADNWADEWGDDLISDRFDPIASEKPATEKSISQTPASKKPSLLATPLILIGWLKDVSASLTRPKPARPVIDIPRREMADRQVRSRSLQRESPGESPKSTPPAVSPKENNWEEIAQADDSWEESNWDD